MPLDNLTDRERRINYASRLTVLLQGCTSTNCPFADIENRENRCGTANICDCANRAGDLLSCLEASVIRAKVRQEDDLEKED